MSTFSSAAATGAGPSAAIRLDGDCQRASNPRALRKATARLTSEGAGAGVARPKLRLTVVARVAGPRSVALLMAAASVSGGLGMGMGVVAGRAGSAELHADIRIAARAEAATVRNFTIA